MISTVVDHIIIMYDCEWKILRRTDPKIRAFLENFTFGPKIKNKRLSQTMALEQILDKNIRGFAQIDAVVPIELRNPAGLADLPPIIKVICKQSVRL